jgi:hypothetical protein
MLKECKTNERHKLQQVQWKDQGKEENYVKDEGRRLKRI